MSEDVKGRRYESPLRAERAQQTRTGILDAAQRLFLEDGYVRTTLGGIAKEAGVSLATVKLAFGTKTEVLLNVWHRVLAGGVDDGVPVVERDWHKAQYEIADPDGRIAYAVANGVMIKQRIAGLLRVIEQGAATDQELAALLHRMLEENHAVVRQFVQRLADEKKLRPELTVAEGTDLMWTLNHVANYRLLTETRGWTAEKYRNWLTRALQHELLA